MVSVFIINFIGIWFFCFNRFVIIFGVKVVIDVKVWIFIVLWISIVNYLVFCDIVLNFNMIR